jgi:hypothetical protein
MMITVLKKKHLYSASQVLNQLLLLASNVSVI